MLELLKCIAIFIGGSVVGAMMMAIVAASNSGPEDTDADPS